MAQNQAFCQINSPESSWIRYQLDLRNITYDVIAEKAKRTAAFVSLVISRKRKSESVEAALAETLGYPSFKHLWADAFINAGRKAV